MSLEHRCPGGYGRLSSVLLVEHGRGNCGRAPGEYSYFVLVHFSLVILRNFTGLPGGIRDTSLQQVQRPGLVTIQWG